jgi:phosphoglycerate dehydrogenase-like enzyme
VELNLPGTPRPELTVSLPYPRFTDGLAALLDADEAARVRLVSWSFKSDGPEGVEPDEIDLVVLPFHSTARETTEQYVSTEVLRAELPRASRARAVQAPSIGIEGLPECVPDVAALCNAVGVMERPTAELAVTLLLAGMRELPGFIASGSEWDNHRTRGVVGSRVLVVGHGGVGRAVTRMLAGFDAVVVPVASRPRTEPDGTRVHGVAELPDLLPDVDAVVCTLPLAESTAGLFGADAFARMRDGAIFVNVGRGGVVDTDALLAEAESGRLTALLDVTDPEPLPAGHQLWQLPNVVITPHVGGNTDASHRFQAELLAEQVRRLLAGQEPRNIVRAARRPEVESTP